MSDNTYKDGGKRGLGLQCLYSNLFPQLYGNSKIPCTLTPFGAFRELTDHLWKYHSFLLGCELCGHRFLNAKRGDSEEDRTNLDKLKKQHLENDCKNVTPNEEHHLKTMTEAQDKILKKWKAKEPRNKALAKSNYHSLCHSFFGEGVKLPEDYQYHYFVPEYSVNEKSSDLGEFNLGYVRRRRPTTEPEPSCSSHQQSSFQTYYPQPMQPTINPLLLDEGHPPHDWIIHQPAPDQDSAYGSGGTGEPVLPQNTNANMSYLQDPDWHLSTDPFSQDDLYARPLSITEDNWELGNYDEPSG